MSVCDEIKAAFPIAQEFLADGHELRKARRQFVCLCPFHQERTPSCYVTPETGRFKCFGACGENGTVIDYVARSRGVTAADAVKILVARLNDPAAAHQREVQRTAPPLVTRNAARRRPDLPHLETGSVAEIRTLALLRTVSKEAVQAAEECGLVRFCDLNDGAEAVRAWVLCDRTRRNAQARRMDGQRWQYCWDFAAKTWISVRPEQQKKVRGFFGNQASWPVGLEEAASFKSVALVEGVDLLAAFHFIFAEERESKVAPVTILGASNRIPADALTLFAGKRVRIFPHVDANGAGFNAAAQWETQLKAVAASVDAFDLAGLSRSDGAAIKDLNDLTSIDPDCFEAERDVWTMMHF